MLPGDEQVLEEFHRRRKMFDAFVRTNELPLFTCPSCGYATLDERGVYDICSVCCWEDDNQDDDTADEVWGGPNADLSLTESRIFTGRLLREHHTRFAAPPSSAVAEAMLAIHHRRYQGES